ncbi:MAG: class II fructose-bisphosphate aldolase [Lutispora sp.]
MLVNLKDILEIAEKGNFAIPAFNTYNMETVMGVIDAAEELNAPVILQSYSRMFNSDNGYYLSKIIIAAANRAKVPVCFHLDHGKTELEVIRGIRYGCTGIMIDASNLPLEENIEITRKITDISIKAGIPVEGELGHIGSTKDELTHDFTDVDEAEKFVQVTNVTALAISVGTAHGRYKRAPKLDIKRIADINKKVKAFLVLHGGSGVPDSELQYAVEAGIRKVNFGTDLCYSFLDKIFETSRELVAIDLFMKEPIESVKKFAMEKIRILGAENKA